MRSRVRNVHRCLEEFQFSIFLITRNYENRYYILLSRAHFFGKSRHFAIFETLRLTCGPWNFLRAFRLWCPAFASEQMAERIDVRTFLCKLLYSSKVSVTMWLDSDRPALLE